MPRPRFHCNNWCKIRPVVKPRPRPETPTVFGTNLRKYREAAGLSQRDLAELSELTQTTISYLETGRHGSPKWATVRALCRTLECAPSELLGHEVAKMPDEKLKPRPKTAEEVIEWEPGPRGILRMKKPGAAYVQPLKGSG